MKVGDKVKVKNRPDLGQGKVIRFYANQGTVMVKFEKTKATKYCNYCVVVEDKEDENEK